MLVFLGDDELLERIGGQFEVDCPDDAVIVEGGGLGGKGEGEAEEEEKECEIFH